MNVAEFVWSRLHEWGLSRMDGYPGDGAGGLDITWEERVQAGSPGEPERGSVLKNTAKEVVATILPG